MGRAARYDLKESPILLRQQTLESNARSYPRRLPIALARAQGVYVEDTEGRVFLDCLSAAGTLVLGHNHPEVVAAIERSLQSGLPMQTLDLTTPVKDEFIAALFDALPRSFAAHARIQFCGPTGTDAVEAALKLVRTATGRKTMLAFHGAYHGMSQGALGLMGNLGPKIPHDGVLGNVQFLPFPYAYRCPFGLGGAAGESASLAYIENVLSDPESGVVPPAGIIVEPVQGEGGVIPASARWLEGLRRIATAAKVPLIFDEVQTGFGRTGKLFAFEHADVMPDVLVLSKALGGGLPMSVMVYHEDLDRWQPGAHAGTFRGNQLAMVAGLATLEIIRRERLDLAARALGERMHGGLLALKREFACVGDVRGVGLMLGVELVDARAGKDRQGHPLASREVARAVQAACLRRGLILEVGGRYGATLRMLPPLIITESELDVVLDTIRLALHEVTVQPGPENLTVRSVSAV
ncbi:MAG: diaminobutyrate--2-oxoglutarate transaminase [Polyangiales bacterium]